MCMSQYIGILHFLYLYCLCIWHFVCAWTLNLSHFFDPSAKMFTKNVPLSINQSIIYFTSFAARKTGKLPRAESGVEVPRKTKFKTKGIATVDSIYRDKKPANPSTPVICRLVKTQGNFVWCVIVKYAKVLVRIIKDEGAYLISVSKLDPCSPKMRKILYKKCIFLDFYFTLICCTGYRSTNDVKERITNR